MTKTLWIVAFSIPMMVSTASASPIIYQYETGPGYFGGSLTADQRSYDSITASYETGGGSDIFSWAVDYGDDPDAAPGDGFWLVVSNGPNPKGELGQLAILYGDLLTGHLLAYEYSGRNDPYSYRNPGNFLGDFSSGLNYVAGSNEYDLTIDVTALNDLYPSPWEGIQFGSAFGIWYHPTWGTNASYYQTRNGYELEYWGYRRQGWFDRNEQVTTQVPEPGTLTLFGLGLIGLGIMRRRKS